MHRAVELVCQVSRQHGKRQAVRRGTHAAGGLPRNPGDFAGGDAHLGGIDHENQFGFETPQDSGAVFGGHPALEHKDVVACGEFRCQQSRCQHPGGVVPVKFVANSKDGNPRRFIL